MTLDFHPDAEAELTEAARWYEERSPGLGDRFISVVMTATEEILPIPGGINVWMGKFRSIA